MNKNYWDYYFKKENNNEHNNKINVLVIKPKNKINKLKVGVSLISSLLIFYLMIGKNLSLNKENPIEKDIYKVRDSDPTDLYDAINKNDNLDEKEKRLIDNSWIFINDYYQYIDFTNVENVLEDFDILYSSDSSGGTAATWNNDKKVITIYGDTDILEKSSSANHEFIHMLSTSDKDYSNFLSEGVTSLICSEYDLTPDAYFRQAVVVRMLCEIIGSDIVMESFLQSDFKLIEDELLKIDNDKEKIEELTNYFEEFEKDFYERADLPAKLVNKEQEEQHNKLVKEEDGLAIKINNILCYYYTQKTGKDVLAFNKIGVNRCDADIVMGIYSDSLINNSNPENFNTNYFNKRLKDYNMSFSYGGYDIECNKDGKYLMKKK